MATTTIPWGDGSGDNIYLTYPSASGDQTVEVSSDANTGSARTKVVTFTTAVGSITKQLTINQAAGGGELSDYVQDGLVLHMDGKEKGDTAGYWESIAGGWLFENHGATFGTDYVSFDGTDDYLSNKNYAPPLSGSGTIEVVYESASDVYGSRLHVMFCGKTLNGIAFAINASKYVLYSMPNTTRNRPISTLSKASISVSTDRAYENGVAMQTTTADYMTGRASLNFIGKRGGNSPQYMKGKIYSIRIYNRKLTQAEVLKNLAVDNARFNLGLVL